MDEREESPREQRHLVDALIAIGATPAAATASEIAAALNVAVTGFSPESISEAKAALHRPWCYRQPSPVERARAEVEAAQQRLREAQAAERKRQRKMRRLRMRWQRRRAGELADPKAGRTRPWIRERFEQGVDADGA